VISHHLFLQLLQCLLLKSVQYAAGTLDDDITWSIFINIFFLMLSLVLSQARWCSSKNPHDDDLTVVIPQFATEAFLPKETKSPFSQ
jgi:hypothetical protein